MSDIVERLRGFARAGAGVAVLIDAADEIERLRAPTGHPLRETIAILLWHRFAPESHIEWEDETHKDEYLFAADDVLFRIVSPSGAAALTKDQ